METKWRIDCWDCSVTQIDVVAQTEHFWTIREKSAYGSGTRDRREKKAGKIFDTFEEAKDALLAHAQRRAASAEQEMLFANNKIKKINALQKPLSE